MFWMAEERSADDPGKIERKRIVNYTQIMENISIICV